MSLKKYKISILIFTMLLLGWASTVYYYEKIRDYPVKNTQDYPVENTIEINGLILDKSFLGITRDEVIKKLGEPKLSALAIKGFEDYQYVIHDKRYGLVVHYEEFNKSYLVSRIQFIKRNLKDDSRTVLLDIQE